ncbi:hypothetical protein GDO86_013232 [Hymenochirus boettgeri]|uniref:Centrosomal protein of 55 kDa n=1 Tax=Hymenochirus boettgeri TaxID=247094 RepID=A0A8T2IQI2_9PIPI|nr:hypothetical protein GDO86_013232 [Hymenochirus boettgeri]
MNSKILGNKLGLKHGTFKMDVELEKLKKENETLKKTLEEITKSKEILTDTERNRLLEETKKGASRDVLESQLKDALEKNQQWLVYDQQREAYVKGLMARIFELEQLGNSNQKILQLTTDAPVEAKQDEEQKKYYDRLLLKAKKDLEDERKFTAQLKSQLSDMQVEYEAQKTKMNALSEQLRSLQNSDIKQNDELKMCFKDKLQKLRNELELSKQNLEEEKSRTTELTNQVKVLNMSLLKQRKDQDRISALELQVFCLYEHLV